MDRIRREIVGRLNILIVAAASIGASEIAKADFVTPSLPGTSENEGWVDLVFTNFSQATYGGGFPGNAPWTDTIDPNVSGSTGNATFDKISGAGYPATQSIYTPFIGGVFDLSNTSSMSFDVETVIFQIDLGPGNQFYLEEPVLNYNGSSQELAADLTAVGPGNYPFANPIDPSQAGTTTIFQYQWDLSAIGPVTDYQVVFHTGEHAQIYEMQLDVGSTFVTIIPEPASLMLVAAGLVTVGAARRRMRA